MKRTVLSAIFAVLYLAVLIAPNFAFATSVQNFSITDFSADYYLSRDSRGVGTLWIEESITVDFPRTNQNHGILRAIPQTYNGNSLNLKIDSVRNEDGTDLPYTTNKEASNLVLQIGSPDTFVHGLNVYKINYSLKNVISFFDDHDELFWDINGVGSSQTFENVTARIHIPSNLTSALQDRQLCYSGLFGTDNHNCQINRSNDVDGVVVEASAQNLKARETLSVVLAFDKGTFNADWIQLIIRYIYIASLVVLPSITLVVMYRRWHKFGRDPKGRGTIIPMYSPPKDMNALSSSVVLKEKFIPDSISAAIIELAVNGYLKIHEVEKKALIGKSTHYELELLKLPNKLKWEQKAIIEIIFGDSVVIGTRVSLDDNKASKFYTAAKSLATKLPEELWRYGYFVTNPQKIRQRYITLGTVLSVVGVFLVALLPNILPGSDLGIPGANIPGAVLPGVGIILSGIIILLFSNAMPARSQHGVKTRNELLGLRDYMKLAEAERIKFLQSPQGVRQYGDPTATDNKLHLFEKLLPYAMLFGIEKDWAKQFEHLYAKPPEWFDSKTLNFNSVYLASSLNTFGNTTAAAFAPPSSSSSSGFSGGGAGGGGGGGGVGGW